MPILIQLTMLVSKTPTIVNMGKIESITPLVNEAGCTIRFIDGWKLSVRETMEQVTEMTTKQMKMVLD